MASINNSSKCPVSRGEIDLDFYTAHDGEWRKLKLAAPARRALVDAKFFKISDLKKIKLSDLKNLHGMGPTAISLLQKAGAKFKAS